MKSQEVPQFTDHINLVKKQTKFTNGDMLEFDSEIFISNRGQLKVDLYLKPALKCAQPPAQSNICFYVPGEMHDLSFGKANNMSLNKCHKTDEQEDRTPFM